MEIEKAIQLLEANGYKVTKPKMNAIARRQQVIYPYTSPEFIQAWDLWLQYRTEIKKPYKGIISEQAALKKLSKYPEQEAIDMIHQSIENTWQGIFETQKTRNNGKQSSTSKSDQAFQRQNGLEQIRSATSTIFGFSQEQQFTDFTK